MKPTRMQTNMRGTLPVLRSAAYSFSLRGTFEVIELQYPGYQRFFSDTSSAVGRSHEPDRNRAKKSLWHPGGQGFESHTSLNFSWLSFAAAKNCVKNAMIFFHNYINSADFVKSLKNFRGERFCRALLGQMFNSWCISCTIYNMHSRDWRLGFTVL